MQSVKARACGDSAAGEGQFADSCGEWSFHAGKLSQRLSINQAREHPTSREMTPSKALQKRGSFG